MARSVNKRNSLINTMVALGLTRRASLLLFVFTTLFLCFITVFIIFNFKQDIYNLMFLGTLIPLVIIDVFIGYVALSKKYIEYFEHEEEIKKIQNKGGESLEKATTGRKAYIGMAYYGSAIALGIIIICISLVLGLENYLFGILVAYFFLAVPFFYKIFGPYLNKKID